MTSALDAVVIETPLANLILAGVGKAGTTSLFWYLSQHQAVCPSLVKETRFFLPLSEAEQSSEGLGNLSDYAAYFRRCGNARYRMEATPHYFHGGKTLVEGIRNALPDVRIVLTLRDPVERLWSIFQFAKSMLILPREISIEDFVSEAEHVYYNGVAQTPENRPYWTSITGSMYASFLPAWLDGLPLENLRVVLFDDLNANPVSVTVELCRWLGLSPDVAGFDFSTQNRTVPVRWRSLQRVAIGLNSERLLRNRRVIKRPLRWMYHHVNATRTENMPLDCQSRLEELFRQSNLWVGEALTMMGYSSLPAWQTDRSEV